MELLGPSIQMWITFALILAAITSYALDRVSMEITSLGTICALLFLFHFMPVIGQDGRNLLDAKILLSGFADPSLISILALLVIGQGMVQTGALEAPAQILIKHGINRPHLIIWVCLISVMVISALLNNTPVVVIFIPIMITLVDKLGKSSSQVLLPLSYVAILGGMTTLIGSSTNLLVAGSYNSLTGGDIGLFDFIVPGLFMAGLGLVYIFFFAPYFLPKKLSGTDQKIPVSGKQFIVQIDLIAGNSLIGKKSVAGIFPDLQGMTVRLIQSRGTSYLPPFDDIILKENDSIIIATTRRTLTEKISKDPALTKGVLNVAPPEENDEQQQKMPRQKIAEVMVAPASRLDGRTLEQVGFHLQGGCTVLGVERRARMIRISMSDIRLEAGDILLVVGTSEQILALRANKDVLLMEWSTSEVPVKSDSWKALGIFASVVGAAGTGIIPIPIAATCGAFLMILLNCLNIRQAGRAIDRRIFLLIGAALAMGVSLQVTGGAGYVAHNMIEILAGQSIPVMLSAFFLLIAILTNILSNNATAVLFTPIAINIAEEVGADPMMFVTAVIFAANCSFATPMGYQTNLLVIGPGNYRFNDFLRVGIPLIILLWIGFSLFAPWYYEL